jgi:indolepyruvate ferredoxin oxidoreductase, alpha subunit
VIEENCNLCKLCLMVTGCSAITLGADTVEIETDLCYGCGICVDSCHREALVQEAA